MSMIRSVSLLAKRAMSPVVPAGTIAALATMVPVGHCSRWKPVAASGRWATPSDNPAAAWGTTVKFSE